MISPPFQPGYPTRYTAAPRWIAHLGAAGDDPVSRQNHWTAGTRTGKRDRCYTPHHRSVWALHWSVYSRTEFKFGYSKGYDVTGRGSSQKGPTAVSGRGSVFLPEPAGQVLAQPDVPEAAVLEQLVVDLKRLQKGHVSVRTQGYYDRVQRGLSWLAKSKRCTEDPESGFIFAWIALNALCGLRTEVLDTPWWEQERSSCLLWTKEGSGPPDPEIPSELEWYLWRISGLDEVGSVVRRVIKGRQADLETILRTEYLISRYWFWRWRNATDISQWRNDGEAIVQAAIGPSPGRVALYSALCEIIVWRLRTLRNQLFHGSATDMHSKRRDSGQSELEAGWRLLSELVWAFLGVMATPSARAAYWPPSPFPRAGSPQHRKLRLDWLSQDAR